MIRIEDMQCEGLLPILESFPSYGLAIKFVMTFRPSFIYSPQNLTLEKEFTEHTLLYYEDGVTKKREQWTLEGNLHRPDGPADIGFHENGMKWWEHWYLNGKYHRIDGSATIRYNGDGITHERWYLHGLLHKIGGPAQIGYFENGTKSYERWYLNGQLHRRDGPAYIDYNRAGKRIWQRWYLEDFVQTSHFGT